MRSEMSHPASSAWALGTQMTCCLTGGRINPGGAPGCPQCTAQWTRQHLSPGRLTCARQCFWVGGGPHSQSVEQLPEGARVAPQLRAAPLTSYPLHVAGEEDSSNLGERRRKGWRQSLEHLPRPGSWVVVHKGWHGPHVPLQPSALWLTPGTWTSDKMTQRAECLSN